MAYGDALKTYQKTGIETADPLQLIVMCYDAAIQDLEIASEFHVAKSMDRAYEKIRHAQDIVTELLVGLDYDRGGDIAVNLSRLYNFVLRQLIGINSMQGAAVYAPLIRILTELRDAWVQARANLPSSQASGDSTPGRGWEASA